MPVTTFTVRPDDLPDELHRIARRFVLQQALVTPQLDGNLVVTVTYGDDSGDPGPDPKLLDAQAAAVRAGEALDAERRARANAEADREQAERDRDMARVDAAALRAQAVEAREAS